MNLFRHLLLEAQFHGSNRLTERKYWFWWAVGLALCFWAACCIIVATIWRFLENPAHLVILEKTNTWTRFPSVIVCPEISYPQYKIDAYLSELKYPPGWNESELRPIIRQLAAFYSPDMEYSIADLKKIEMLLDYNHVDVETASRYLGLTCEETILRCRFFGVMVNCSSIFKMELTNYGYCCVFNGRSLRRDIKTHGLQEMKPPAVLLASEDGHTSGLMFVVNASQEVGDVDLTYKWVYLEKGSQFAESGGNGTPILANEEFWFTYDSKRFVIEENARNLSPELRRCAMSQEKLRYFPSYDRKYCMMECEMQRTMSRCHCVRFTHPRPPHWTYCEARNLLCVRKSAVSFSAKCGCPPTCDTNIDMTMVRNFPLIPGSYTLDPFYNDLDFSKVCVVRAFILRHNTKVYARRSYYTSSQLFSQIGGTMNVFFGCSILTIAELLQLLWYGYKRFRDIGLGSKQKWKKEHKPSTAKKKDSPKKKNAVKKKNTVKKKKKAVKFFK